MESRRKLSWRFIKVVGRRRRGWQNAGQPMVGRRAAARRGLIADNNDAQRWRLCDDDIKLNIGPSRPQGFLGAGGAPIRTRPGRGHRSRETKSRGAEGADMVYSPPPTAPPRATRGGGTGTGAAQHGMIAEDRQERDGDAGRSASSRDPFARGLAARHARDRGIEAGERSSTR